MYSNLVLQVSGITIYQLVWKYFSININHGCIGVHWFNIRPAHIEYDNFFTQKHGTLIRFRKKYSGSNM